MADQLYFLAVYVSPAVLQEPYVKWIEETSGNNSYSHTTISLRQDTVYRLYRASSTRTSTEDLQVSTRAPDEVSTDPTEPNTSTGSEGPIEAEGSTGFAGYIYSTKQDTDYIVSKATSAGYGKRYGIFYTLFF